MLGREEVIRHFELLDLNRPTFALLCRAPVTVRSQQVRALNLAWALSDRLDASEVAVIGGGAAGLTFAAAAAVLGAEVHLYERSANLMHLQEGCWHRPLHPQIFTWPADTAYRPVAYLPLLGWQGGTAHEVSREIVGKFQSIKRRFRNLQVTTGVQAQITADGAVTIGAGQTRSYDINILAVGFGGELNSFGLPLASY
jgi:cation diffusion facilitator CzcD-associated flavoprotein CzcO